MKGTGVQTDPYLIETWDDFFDMSNDSGSTYYMLMNDLDGNDYNGGVFPAEKEVHTNLDGNGHTIRNIYNMDAGSDYLMIPNTNGGTWKNLNIENVVTTCPFWGYNQSNAQRHHYFRKCNFSMKCTCFSKHMTTDCIECAISMDATNGVAIGSAYGHHLALVRSHLKCKVSNPNTYYMQFTADTSRVELDVGDVSSVSSGFNTTVSNSVLAIKIEGEPSDVPTISGNVDVPSVLDSTLWQVPTTGIGTGIIMLPTEDMKNADALNAAGFTVARVS